RRAAGQQAAHARRSRQPDRRPDSQPRQEPRRRHQRPGWTAGGNRQGDRGEGAQRIKRYFHDRTVPKGSNQFNVNWALRREKCFDTVESRYDSKKAEKKSWQKLQTISSSLATSWSG